MNRVPLQNYNLTPLQEDLEVLGLVPRNVSEAKKAKAKDSSKCSKKGKDYSVDGMDDSYDYGDEYDTEESVDSDESNPVIEQAQRLLDAFDDLTEDEIDELSDEQFQAIENAADLLGVSLDEKLLSASERARRAKNAEVQNSKEKLRNKKVGIWRKRNASKVARTRAAWEKSAAGKKSMALSAKRSAAKRSKDEQGANESISNIIERLNTLTKTATEDQDELDGLSDKIVEGLKSVFTSADELANRIASELSEDEAGEDDARFELGEMFHGIAEDAKNLLDRIFEHGDVRMEDAIEDLQSLASDLKRGLRRAARG